MQKGHAAAASAAAQTAVARARRFDEVEDGKRTPERVTRCFVDVVVAAEVAGVVIGNRQAFAVLSGEGKLFVGKEPLDVGGVVNHLVVAAELRILVADLMEAVGTARDDRADLITVEGLDVLLGEHLIEVLVAHASRRIAVAALFLAEYGEPDIGRLKDACDGDGDLLRAIVEGTHAPDPEEHVGALSTFL
jgi:hypothetical protein